LAETITWSLLNFLCFRCPSPSGSCRKVKHPNAWRGGGGTGQGTTAAGKPSQQGGGRAEPEQPTFTLHAASSLRSRGRNRVHLCKQLTARPSGLLQGSGTPRLNRLHCFCEETPSRQCWALALQGARAQAGLPLCRKNAETLGPSDTWQGAMIC